MYKLSLLLDRIYAKFFIITISLSLLLLGLSFYLYPKLPSYIPTHIFLRRGFDNWWHKEVIFIYPLIFLILGITFSKSNIAKQFSQGKPLFFIESFAVVLTIIVLIATLFAFNFYFNMT